MKIHSFEIESHYIKKNPYPLHSCFEHSMNDGYTNFNKQYLEYKLANFHLCRTARFWQKAVGERLILLVRKLLPTKKNSKNHCHGCRKVYRRKSVPVQRNIFEKKIMYLHSEDSQGLRRGWRQIGMIPALLQCKCINKKTLTDFKDTYTYNDLFYECLLSTH